MIKKIKGKIGNRVKSKYRFHELKSDESLVFGKKYSKNNFNAIYRSLNYYSKKTGIKFETQKYCDQLCVTKIDSK